MKPFLLERYFAKHEFTAPLLLSCSDCDGLPQAELLAGADAESRALWESLTLGYAESRGLPLLRREIASAYRGVDPEQVLVAAPQELIFLAMSALLGPRDHVVCTWPGYQSLYEVAESLGCEVSRWEPDPRDGWRFDVGALLGLLRPQTKLVVANFPHNPTGYLPPPGDYERLLGELDARGVRLFSDEMYRLLELSGSARLPSACERSPRAVTLSGVSKTLGLAGLRIGWLVVKDPALYARLCELRDYTTICSAAPAEVLALAGLRASGGILARHRARIARNLELLDGFFARRSGLFSWTRPRAGSVGFPGWLGTEPVSALCDRAVQDAGVMVLPSTVYGYPAPHVRVGFGRERMPEALARFDEFLG